MIIMKFGGTSLSTPERRELAAARVLEHAHGGTYRAEPEQVVVVVSAMGRRGDPYATDTLLDLFSPFSAAREVPARESDAMAACGEEISAALFAALLNARGARAVSMRGFQAGVITDAVHRDAQITELRPARVLAALRRGEVVVVAGFQGTSLEGGVTCIGRGGSDTTAMALGVALGATRIEIFTDVDGVMTADPRVVPGARSVEHLGFEESAEMAFKGSKVLHPAAAELIRSRGGTEGANGTKKRTDDASRPKIVIRNTLSEASGTWLVSEDERISLQADAPSAATSVTSSCGIAQISVTGIDFLEELATLERVFGVIAERGVSLDMMSILPDRVAFTCARASVGLVATELSTLGVTFTVKNDVAKVTLVGGGIHGVPGIMHRMVRALCSAGIGVYQSVDSNMIVGVLIPERRVDDAVRALHEEFFGE